MEPTQNTATKKQAGQEEVDSDYVFGNFSQLSALALEDLLETIIVIFFSKLERPGQARKTKLEAAGLE